MLAIKRQYKSNIINLSTPPQLVIGQTVSYLHGGRILVGKVWGTITTKVQRHMVNGEYPTVYEYIVEPNPDYSNLKYHTVYEGNIMWGQTPAPVCLRCNDHGFISISGDEAQECPVCNSDVGEVVY